MAGRLPLSGYLSPPTKTGNDALAALLKLHVEPWLRQKGFRRFGYRFVLWRNGTCQVIKIMLDRRRKTGPPPFALYLGVFSRRLWYFESDHAPVPKAPDQPQCQWGGFLEQFLPRYQDYWYEVADEGRVPEVGREICTVLETEVLPILSKVQSDQDLQAYWLTGRSPGAGNIQRLSYLAYLGHAIGPKDEVKRFVAELRSVAGGTPAGERALEKLARLGEE